MNCEQCIERINDAVDGVLPDKEHAAFMEHLADCDSCGHEYSMMETILAEAHALPKKIDPERDLWSHIHTRIDGPSGGNILSFPLKKMSVMVPFAAAAALVFMALSGQLRPTDAPTSPPKHAAQQSEPESNPADDPDETIDLATMEADYAQARDSLMQALETRRDQLPDELIVTIEENLNIIENAVVDINRALEANPQDPELERMLHAAYRSEVTLLQRVVQLDETES